MLKGHGNKLESVDCFRPHTEAEKKKYKVCDVNTTAKITDSKKGSLS